MKPTMCRTMELYHGLEVGEEALGELLGYGGLLLHGLVEELVEDLQVPHVALLCVEQL